VKDFTKIVVPQSDRLEVNSREGKLLNKAFWAAIGLLVKQINAMLTSLLANINPDFPLWGSCNTIRIHNRDSILRTATIRVIAAKHNLGRIPRYWIVINKQSDIPEPSAVVRDWGIQRTDDPAWTKDHVFFRIAPTDYGQNIFWDILLLP